MRKYPHEGKGGYMSRYHVNFPFACPEPTAEEINIHKLWKDRCGHWVSLINHVKPRTEI